MLRRVADHLDSLAPDVWLDLVIDSQGDNPLDPFDEDELYMKLYARLYVREIRQAMTETKEP